ncbi:MAG: YqgE/AlgH family protein [Ferruginibacter sp.]|nr:YqgE/AlgH family protein [Ferruginibacter sp.]
MEMPINGLLLIAQPFLKDETFCRSVVLLCKHHDSVGTFGFVLNKKLQSKLNEYFEDLIDLDLPVFYGGPVHNDTIHYIHQYPQYFDDAVKIADNIFWGGNFEKLKTLLLDGTIEVTKIKFFLGYSGWSAGQLYDELKEKSWITAAPSTKIIFETKENNVWVESLTKLGGKYKMMVHFPTDPQLN